MHKMASATEDLSPKAAKIPHFVVNNKAVEADQQDLVQYNFLKFVCSLKAAENFQGCGANSRFSKRAHFKSKTEGRHFHNANWIILLKM